MRLGLTGDSIITRPIGVYQDKPSQALATTIRQTDAAFTNLEVLPNDFQGYPAVESGGTHLAAHGWVLDELVDFGFRLFGCANNHALDYSIEGLLATIRALEQRRLAFAGIGRTLAEARMPTYHDTSAGSIAMISCTSTFAKGQEAGEQRAEMQGRPGVNPLRFEVTYEVTKAQLSALRAIAKDLGLERRRQRCVQLGFAFPPEDPDVFPLEEVNLRSADLLHAGFVQGDEPRVRTIPKWKDLEGLLRWTREARARADVVLISFHTHEEGDSPELPAAFAQSCARDLIDAGADIIACHGPHLIRGLEIRKGRPIFYSLGNFVGQNELVHKLPEDAYENFRVDRSKTPSELFRDRYRNDEKGFPADERYWQSIAPICNFADGALSTIEILPVSLGHGGPPHRRGRPRLAQGSEGEAILERFVGLSQDLGTDVSRRQDRAIVDLEQKGVRA